MKLKKYVAGIVCLAILFTGCANQEIDKNDSDNNKTEIVKPNYKNDYELSYSNLVDEKSISETVEKLINSGVDKEYVDKFIEKVNSFNEIMKGMDGIVTEITSVESSQADYNELFGLDKWEELQYPYEDFNCRITSFDLFKDFIKSEGEYSGNISTLGFDLDTIKNHPLSKFTKEDVDKFTNLFAVVETTDTSDKDELVKQIKNALEERNISFKDDDKISIINGYLHSYDFNEIFIGHTGVLIEDEDELLFVEKYAPLLPYQVSKFNNKKELHSYLMDRLDVDTTGNGCEPIIFENGAEMKY